MIVCANVAVRTQVLLQLEITKEVQAVKFGVGQKVTFKSQEFPNVWQQKKIERILLEENVLVFEDGMININDITHFQLRNNAASNAGKMLMAFSAGWFLFGGVAVLANNIKFNWGTFAIGAVAGGLGWFMDKVISRKNYKIGKNAQLRIIDISFPTPEEVQKLNLQRP